MDNETPRAHVAFELEGDHMVAYVEPKKGLSVEMVEELMRHLSKQYADLNMLGGIPIVVKLRQVQ